MRNGYTVRYEKRVQKNLKKMDRFQASMIMSWIDKNLEGNENPRLMGKPLFANLSGQWRYRIGDHRLICHIDDDELIILALELGHRKDIYR